MVTRVQLLGSVQAQVGSRSIPFLADQRYQLLVYLAYHQDWVSRERLHYLFWSEHPDKRAKDNLRQLLQRVRSLDFLKDLVIERQRLCWRVETDMSAFVGAVGKEQWNASLEHYRGPFLQGLEGKESNEFGTWLSLERDRLYTDWRRAVFKQAEVLATKEHYLEAMTLLKRLLQGDDPDEEALKLYMQLALRAGGRDQALKAYEAFIKRLEEDLDLGPTSALEEFARQIRTETYSETYSAQTLESEPTRAGEVTASSPLTTLPTLTSPFIGRDLELADVAAFLSKPECRLPTLTGLGGAGKTRMALRVAEQLVPNYPDGVCFVGLAALASPTLLPASIAERLNLSLQGQSDAGEQVAHFIGSKQLLLVLDNFEQLLAGAGLVENLVRACPNLTLLVTSRERLNVEAEWLLPLEGLNYPQDEPTKLTEALQFDAPHLFVQRAKRVKPDFSVGRDELKHLLNICRGLEGSPLGLELAAVWVRVMSLEDIAAEINSSIDFLESKSRSKVARHQSLWAVFEHSWQLSTPKEREALRKLSVFAGGFNREAAKQVGDVSLPVLAALVDKSLLRVAEGRYSRHMLVYQYSREKLAEQPEERVQTEANHSSYFMRFVAAQRAALRGPDSKAAFAALDEDLDNIRVAWRWALEQLKADSIEQATFPLSNYLARRARFQEALEVFGLAAAALTSDPARRRALGGVLTEQGWHSFQLGRYPEARASAERGLALARAAKDSTTTMLALNALGCIANKTGDYREARSYHREAIGFPKSQQLSSLQSNLLNNAAVVERSLGNYKKAKAYAREALTFYELSGNRVDLLHYPLQLGEISLYQNELVDAYDYFSEGLAEAQSLGVQSRISDYLVMLARTLFEMSRFDEALEHCQAATKMMEANGGHSRDGSTLKNTLARLVAQHDEAAAHTLFRESLSTAWSRGELPKVLETLTYLAELLLKEQYSRQAAELLSLARHHPGSEDWLKEHASRLLKLGEPGLEHRAQARKIPELAELIPSLLAEWPNFSGRISSTKHSDA